MALELGVARRLLVAVNAPQTVTVVLPLDGRQNFVAGVHCPGFARDPDVGYLWPL